MYSLIILTSGNLLLNKTGGTYCHKTGTRPPSCQAPQQQLYTLGVPLYTSFSTIPIFNWIETGLNQAYYFLPLFSSKNSMFKIFSLCHLRDRKMRDKKMGLTVLIFYIFSWSFLTMTRLYIFVLTNFFNINAIYIEIKLQVC